MMTFAISMHDQIDEAEVLKIYQSMGFVRAGQTQPMWIYAGTEH